MSGYSRGRVVDYWHSISSRSHGAWSNNHVMNSGWAWTSANRATYVPFVIPSRVVVVGLGYGNSSTAIGNYDIGLYDAGGTALLRKGSTAKGSATDMVVWDCTDTTIGPGLYYVALVFSDATADFYGTDFAAPMVSAWGCLTEASALPLPATATFARDNTLTYIPEVAILTHTAIT